MVDGEEGGGTDKYQCVGVGVAVSCVSASAPLERFFSYEEAVHTRESLAPLFLFYRSFSLFALSPREREISIDAVLLSRPVVSAERVARERREARNGPAAQDHEHDACLYDSSSLQQQRSFYGLHHYQQQLHLSPPPPAYTVQQQQQQLFSNLQALKEKSRQESLLSRMSFANGGEFHSIQQQQQHASNWHHHQSDKLNPLKSPQHTYHDQARSPATGGGAAAHEHLFYKVVTPSDVGKLNRLVIPKQHAERWFPLDPCLRKKGRLLSFQDVVSRELWWFRYSYWSSSQSYVLTKGWIRFVKDKDLQAGDIISFERGARHELYINCRKRPTSGRAAFAPLPGDEAFDQQHEQQQQQHLSSHFPVSPFRRITRLLMRTTKRKRLSREGHGSSEWTSEPTRFTSSYFKTSLKRSGR